jgi:galactose-1-phosphate uridylyltransferase
MLNTLISIFAQAPLIANDIYPQPIHNKPSNSRPYSAYKDAVMNYIENTAQKTKKYVAENKAVTRAGDYI